jgi:hypothetical protein
VPTLRLCVLYGSQNKQQLLLYKTLRDWFLWPKWSVYSAVRTESLKQIRFVFNGLISLSTCYVSSIFTQKLLTQLPVKQLHLLIRSPTYEPVAEMKKQTTGIWLKGPHRRAQTHKNSISKSPTSTTLQRRHCRAIDLRTEYTPILLFNGFI